jgi:hypothetical protein
MAFTRMMGAFGMLAGLLIVAGLICASFADGDDDDCP